MPTHLNSPRALLLLGGYLLAAVASACLAQACERFDPPPEVSLDAPSGDQWRPDSPLVLRFTEAITPESLQSFVEGILLRMIFDGEQLVDLLAPLDLGWKERSTKELALMDDLVPMLKKRAQGRDISGLSAYEQ